MYIQVSAGHIPSYANGWTLYILKDDTIAAHDTW